MIGHIQIRERGSTPRRMRREMNRLQKDTWQETGQHFHVEMRESRFTPDHAREAGYTKRKGENLPRGSKRFRGSYYGRKLKSEMGGGRGRADPLVFSGHSKRASRRATISATSKGVNVRYPGLRVFNFRHPKSRVNMAAEFRRVLPREAAELAGVHDEGLDRRLAREAGSETQTL